MVSEPVLVPLEMGTVGTTRSTPCPLSLPLKESHLLGIIFRHLVGDLGFLAALCGRLKTRKGLISQLLR